MEAKPRLMMSMVPMNKPPRAMAPAKMATSRSNSQTSGRNRRWVSQKRRPMTASVPAEAPPMSFSMLLEISTTKAGRPV